MLNKVYHTLPPKNTPVLLSYAALRTVYIYKSKDWGRTYANFTDCTYHDCRAVHGLGGAGGALHTDGTTAGGQRRLCGRVMLTASLTDLLPEALDFYAAYLPPLGSGGAAVSLLALGMLTAALLGRLCPRNPSWPTALVRAATRPARRPCARPSSPARHCCCTTSQRAYSRSSRVRQTRRWVCALRRPLHCTTSRRALPWRCPFAYNPQPRSRCAGGACLRAGGTLGSGVGLAVPAPVFYTRLFDGDGRAGGGHYGMGGSGPAAAPGHGSQTSGCGHFGAAAGILLMLLGIGAAVNVVYYIRIFM